MVDKTGGIVSAHENLSHMRDVEHSDIFPNRLMFRDYACRIADRHIEACKRAHYSAQGYVGIV